MIQVKPVLDCSGYAVYISQTKMKGKISLTKGEITYVTAMKPLRTVFKLLVPATGTVYWSENYPGDLVSSHTYKISLVLQVDDLKRQNLTFYCSQLQQVQRQSCSLRVI